jgi:hypothetical protein
LDLLFEYLKKHKTTNPKFIQYVFIYTPYLYGNADTKTLKGLAPTIRLLIIRGSIICNGTNGIAIKANFSFGNPASIIFKLVTASQALKPTYSNIKQPL